jgi:hypothetical protein
MRRVVNQMRRIVIGAAAALASAALLSPPAAKADPVLEMPSWMGGDHDPYPLIAAIQAWDPDSGQISVTAARNNAVAYCSMRHAGNSEARLIQLDAEEHGAADAVLFRPVLRAAELHFCPEYS